MAAVLGTAACNGCHGCSGDKDTAAAPVDPPVPAPEALLADAYVVSPNPAWSKLQRGVGGAMGILPATLPSIVAMLAELDPRVSGELDATAPMFGVMAGDPAAPAFCVAMKLVDPRRARMLLLEGEAAAYTAREEGEITHLVPRAVEKEKKPAAAGALTKNGYLVVGRAPPDLARLAPYTTRTLPQRPLPTEGALVVDVPRSSVKELLAPKLEAAWADAKSFLLAEDERMRVEHGGRAPDLGDPKPIVAALDAVIGRRIAVFRELERVRLAFDVDEGSVLLHATLSPVAGDGPAKKWIEGMRVGDASTVLALPASAAFALSMRDTDEDRAAQTDEMEKAVTGALGDRLKPDEAKRLHDMFADWTKGRGETLAVSYVASDPRGSLLTTQARDAESAARALRSAVELARVSPFKELLRVKDVTSSSEDVPGIGRAEVATFTREPKKEPAPPFALRARDAGAAKAPAPSAIGLSWAAEGGRVVVAVGDAPVATMKEGARPEKKLRDEPLVARFAEEIGDHASTIVVAQPLRIDPKRADAPPAPLVFALTRKGQDAVLRMDVSSVLLRELSRTFVGF